MLYIIFMISCFSLTSILVDQKIFEECRVVIKESCQFSELFIAKKLYQLLQCHFCTGFWSGVAVCYFLINPFNLTSLDPLLGGLIGSFSAYYINLVLSVLEKYAEERFSLDI